MTVVMDASAVLAWALDEPGADSVEPQFADAVITAPNWAEVLQRISETPRDVGLVASVILGFDLIVIPVGIEEAAEAARLWNRRSGLSLGDRFCIAAGRTLDLPIWTCDRAWADVDERVVLIR